MQRRSTRTASAIAIVLAALALTPASLESAEITGCLTKRGTLTRVAPGPRPAAPCSPQQAKRVSISVVSGAGMPNAARVDIYSFFAEVDATEPGGGKEVFTLEGYFPVRISGYCYPVRQSNVAAIAVTGGFGHHAIVPSAEGRHNPDSDSYAEVAEIGSPPSGLEAQLGAGVQTMHVVGSHIRARVEVAATVTGERPALCTFNGTVDIIRAR